MAINRYVVNFKAWASFEIEAETPDKAYELARNKLEDHTPDWEDTGSDIGDPDNVLVETRCWKNAYDKRSEKELDAG